MSKPYIPHDAWSQKAKKEGYRARSVYKLREIDEKYHLLHPGMKVLDVGAAPGSWLQYISKKIGGTGLALGIDLQEIEPVAANVVTKVCDFTHTDEVEKHFEEMGWKNVDIVVSDIMANTTGVKLVDREISIRLNRQVLEVAKKYLKPRGYLLMKIFEGEGFREFLQDLRERFSEVKIVKTKASRARSREVYVICH